MSIKIKISKKGYGKPYYIISMSNGFNGLLSVKLQTRDFEHYDKIAFALFSYDTQTNKSNALSSSRGQKEPYAYDCTNDYLDKYAEITKIRL